jgi:hypothetical protein
MGLERGTGVVRFSGQNFTHASEFTQRVISGAQNRAGQPHTCESLICHSYAYSVGPNVTIPASHDMYGHVPAHEPQESIRPDNPGAAGERPHRPLVICPHALNNPVRYTDPTGHITQGEDQDAQLILQQLLVYDVNIRIDWGMQGKKWSNGLWTLAELQTVLDSVQDLANAMGGTDNFKTNLGGVTISQKSMKYGGVGKAHDVTMNANGFSKWAVVHELVHAWDGANGWDLSEDMKSSLGAGFDHPILHFLFPNNRSYWYDPGKGPPPAGLVANFNAREDFAESVTAFVYPGEASNAASNRGWPYNDSSRGYSYSSFLYTPRGQYIYALMVSLP